jgi:hypothetical protein
MPNKTLTISVLALVAIIVAVSVSKQLSLLLAIILGGMVVAGYYALQSHTVSLKPASPK